MRVGWVKRTSLHTTKFQSASPMIFDGGDDGSGLGCAAQELSGIDLDDARLNKRSVMLLDRLADKPTASIPNASNGWAETQAAYRFLAQEDIGWEDILAPHFSCTHERIQDRPVVLCLQDTTELDFNGQEIAGLGTLSYAAQRGMYLHPTYAVSPEREPLGVLDAWMWVRDGTKKASPERVNEFGTPGLDF